VIKDIRPALRTFLLADAGIRAVVGNARVFEYLLPQGVRDTSLVYQAVSELGDHHMQGPSGLTAIRMQIDAYAELRDTATTLANGVKGRLDGFRGWWPMAAPGDSIKVRGVFFDGVVPIAWDEASSLHRVGRLYIIHFGER
jgi:hypothetical protein